MKNDLFSIIATAAVVSGCAVIIASAAHGNIKRAGSFDSAAKTQPTAQQSDRSAKPAPEQPARLNAAARAVQPITAQTVSSSTAIAPAINTVRIRDTDDDDDRATPDSRELRDLEEE